MAYPSFEAILKDAARLSRENLLQSGISQLSQLPHQIHLKGERSFMSFQPHAIAHVAHSLTFEATRILVDTQTEQYIDDGRRVVFFLEDANKKDVSGRRNRERQLRSGDKGTSAQIGAMTESLAKNSPMALYQSEQLDLVREQMEKHPEKKDDEPQVVLLFECAPKIQTPGHQVFEEQDPRKYPPDLAYRRMSQIIAYTATRDIATAAQMIREAEADPKTGFIVMRGTLHAGMAACLEEMAALAYPQHTGKFANVDTPKTILTDEIVAAQLPITWQRRFWRQIFEKSPYLLKLPSSWAPGKDMEQTVGIIRSLLKSSPWNDYLRSSIEQISHMSEHEPLVNLTLCQGQL